MSADKLKIHPAANWLPELPAAEYDELKANIAKRGLRDPILVKDGHILDGRHRYRACQELNIEPRIVEYEGTDLIEEIASRNLFRRNLTPEKRAELVVKMLGDKVKADAEARIKAHQFGVKPTASTKMVRAERTTETIARIAKVPRRTAEAALRGGKPPPKRKPQPKEVDKTSKKYVTKRFIGFMDHWLVTEHRAVRKILRDMLCPVKAKEGK